MRSGMHARKPDTTATVYAARRAAAMTLLAAACVAVFTVTAAVYAARAAVTLTARGVAGGWRRMPAAGRVIAGTVVAFAAAGLVSALGLIPEERWAVLAAGGGISFFYGLWLIGWQRAGQREWRERGGTVMPGRADASPAGAIALLGDLAAEVAAQRQEIAVLRRTVTAVCREGGLAVPRELLPQPHLYAVGDGTGPLPRVR